MPPAAQNEAPSNGMVRLVGPLQTEIEPGFRVLVSFIKWVKKVSYYWRDARLYFYDDDEVIALLTHEGEVFPRLGRVIIRPSWDKLGVVKHGEIHTIQRIFQAPEPPRFGTVLKIASDCTTIKVGDVVVVPKYGGQELAVKDRVLYSIKEKDIPGVLVNAVDNDSIKPARHRAKTTRGSR